MATRLLTEEVPAPEAVVRALIDGGVDHVYGMPGGATVLLFDALFDHRDAVRTVLVREEARAGVMAEVHGRLTGRPAVCMGQGAFMVHASLGAIEAHLSASPMLLLADLSDGAPYTQHGPYQSGAGTYGSWNAEAVFGGLCKRVFVARTPVDAVRCVQLGLRHATTGEPGPVAVLFSGASLRGTVGPASRPTLWATGDVLGRPALAVDATAIDAAAQLLTGARRPVIVAGGGVRVAGAYDDLARLARALGAPVATTAGGKGVFAETDDWAVGVFGNFGTPLANAVVADADVVLAVGTKLGPNDTAQEHPALLDPARQRLVHVDVEPLNLGWSFPAAIAVTGDARIALSRLAEAVAGTVTSDLVRARADLLDADVVTHGRFDAPELTSDAVPLLPQRVIHAVHAAVGTDAIVCCDAGENRIFMTHHFRTTSAPGFLQPAGVGGMGYALPAAFAAQLACPGRRGVAVCGDGGFAISMNTLMTAREEGVPVVTVVLNNGTLGWVAHSQRDRPIASDLGEFDHAAIAVAMGCRGVRVERPDELAPALAHALAADVPTVVDVVTSPDETFETVTSPLLRQARPA
jgi:acetolactate synthase I/II/III large subunit